MLKKNYYKNSYKMKHNELWVFENKNKKNKIKNEIEEILFLFINSSFFLIMIKK